MNEWEQLTFDLDIWCGRMSPELSAVTKEKTSGQSLKKLRELRIKPPQFLDLRGGGGATAAASWETGGLLLGEYTMRSFGERPSEENVSRLSQILEAKPHQKYSLSATACAGILRRAENRGKELPEPLKQALIKQSAFKSEQDAKGGKGILIQHEKTGALSTLANQYVCNSSGQEISGTLDSYYGNGCGSRGGVEREVIAYGISAYESNAMKSDNPRSGCYKADTARTLDNNGGNPACNQGGIAVVYDAYQHHGYRENETCGTMTEKQNCFIRGDTPIVIEPILLESNQKHATVQTDGVSTALPASAGMGGGYVPMVVYPINTMVGTRTTAEKRTTMGIGDAGDPQFTISSAHAHAVCIENHPADSRVSIEENGEGGNAYAIGNGQADQTGLHDKAGALNCMHDQQAVITYGLDRASYNQGKNARYNFSVEKERIGAQVAKDPGAVYNTVVRRLTPLECERLQGYPDGWTDIGEWTDSKGKKHKDADSPRYKALGNSIALPFWQWLADRICAQYERETTMASLFDGIGGFPLVFTRTGKCKPVWASEIEEFPIAVTKIRFKE